VGRVSAWVFAGFSSRIPHRIRRGDKKEKGNWGTCLFARTRAFPDNPDMRARARSRSSLEQVGKKRNLLFVRARIRIIRENNSKVLLTDATTISRSADEFPESGFPGGLLVGPLLKQGENLRAYGPLAVCAPEPGLDRI
jgi:hypothetical protein